MQEYETAFDWAIENKLAAPFWAAEQNADDDNAVLAAFRFVGPVWSVEYQKAVEALADLEAAGWEAEHDVDGNLWIIDPELGEAMCATGDFWMQGYDDEWAQEQVYNFRRIRGLCVNTGEQE